ncbi:MAG TPA: DUF2244 domain-containing protein [Gammaproteobacteria bacterium]|nr:DUF2244 domain-containing protein [Gammaproteobacteria bacterium]
MVATQHDEAGGLRCFVLRPSFAVDWRQTVSFFVVLSLVTVSIALTFTVMGYWPILPFAGLELSGLGVALYVSAGRSLDTEVVRVSEDRVEVEKGRRRPERHWDFSRAWCEVVLKPSGHPWYPPRLGLRSRGEWVELGGFLGEDERKELAGELRRWIGPMALAGEGRGSMDPGGGATV